MELSDQCKNAIYDNQYSDFVVRLNGNRQSYESFFGTDCIHELGYRFAVVHVPMSSITQETLTLIGYTTYTRCYGLLDTSALEASGVLRLQNQPTFSLRGSGVLIGLVDTGINYTNSVFQNADGTTKIVSIWDQTVDGPNYPPELNFGTEYLDEQINQALTNENPLSVVPSVDEIGHGTFLASVIAGSRDEANNFVGVVPDANLVVVKLKPAKQNIKDFLSIPQDAICYQDSDIMYGIKYLTDVALRLNRPIAICIALGSNQGPHDGRGALSEFISYYGLRLGVAITVAAGNESNKKHHYYGEVDSSSGFDTVEVNVGENEQGFIMELWGHSPNTHSIDIMSPSGEYIPRIPARINENRTIRFLFEDTVILVSYQLVEAKTGDPLILMRFQNPSPGIWRLKVYGEGDIRPDYHIWLPISSFISDDTFFIQSNPNTTITSPGNALVPITATAINHYNQTLDISSGRGYTRLNLVKPDIAAPGVDVYGVTADGTFGTSSGTSISAAITTGAAAMILEWGIVRQNHLTIDSVEIKQYLIRGAKRDITLSYPNQSWGYGILDIYNTFASFR